MMTRRIVFAVVIVSIAVGVVALVFYKPFPPDKTPEGSYARIAKAIAEQRSRDVFPYLEQDAQDAAFSIHDMRKAASDAIRASYPAGAEKDALLASYRAEAEAPDGPDVFLVLDKKHGFITRLRKDLSGVAKVETEGERATITTAHGARYTFRRRPNGVWGLTRFSAEMLEESERAARDLASVRAAADDYARAKGAGAP
jgi:hypothetical protein